MGSNTDGFVGMRSISRERHAGLSISDNEVGSLPSQGALFRFEV
jgi:hypothetical protein